MPSAEKQWKNICGGCFWLTNMRKNCFNKHSSLDKNLKFVLNADIRFKFERMMFLYTQEHQIYLPMENL